MSILKKLKSLAPALSAVVVAVSAFLFMDIPHRFMQLIFRKQRKIRQMKIRLNRRMQTQLKKRKKRIRKKTRTKKKNRKVQQRVLLMYQMGRITEQEPDLREKSRLRLP